MTDHREVEWDAFTREVVRLWSAGDGQGAFLRLGAEASRAVPDDGRGSREDPPVWLTRDVDWSALGGAGRGAWLLTAFAVIGDELGLDVTQLEMALARARAAAARARSDLRREAVLFRRPTAQHPDAAAGDDALCKTLLRRVDRAVRVGNPGDSADALRELLRLYPEATALPQFLSLELTAFHAVSAHMQRGDIADAGALTEGLAGTIDAMPDVVWQRALGLRGLRGAFQVWRAEAMFSTTRRAEAMAALQIAQVMYDQTPALRDLPRVQIHRLQGLDALQRGHFAAAVRCFADAIAYVTLQCAAPHALVLRCLKDLADAVRGQGGNEAALRGAVDAVIRRYGDDATVRSVARGVYAESQVSEVERLMALGDRLAASTRVAAVDAALAALRDVPPEVGIALQHRMAEVRARLRAVPSGARPIDAQCASAAPWLQPITPNAPAGVDASQGDRFLDLVTEVERFDSPANAPWNAAQAWRSIARSGGELLSDVSKHLTVAAYVAHAMHQCEGAPGLVQGLALLTGMFELYGSTMFPEARRAQRRVNAVAWYVERTLRLLAQRPPTAGDRACIADALALCDRLAKAARADLGERTPAFGTLHGELSRAVFDLG